MSWIRDELNKNAKLSPGTYYDNEIGYAPIWNPALVADLIELVAQPDVQWFELEELLVAAPREAQFVRLLRANQSRSSSIFAASNLFQFSPPRAEFVVDEEACQILLRRLFPYATLLDTHLTPLEQAMQLEREGVDVQAFCGWLDALADRLRGSGGGNNLYSRAAALALQSWRDHYSLLRGAERGQEPAEQLLRATSGATQASEHLLRAQQDAPAPPEQAPATVSVSASGLPARRFWPFRRRSR